MGKALGLTVVAEGVETTEQDAFLRGHLCDELQGFLFSKPVPADDMATLLRPFVSAPSLQPEFPPIKPRKRILKTQAPAEG
jgi:sensor c-di-GMP phosphodiesterase-like protein